MECPKCGRAALDGIRFCAGCGTRLDAPPPVPAADEATCPACGAVHAPGAKFCKSCGGPLAVAADATAVRASEPEPPQPAEPAPVAEPALAVVAAVPSDDPPAAEAAEPAPPVFETAPPAPPEVAAAVVEQVAAVAPEPLRPGRVRPERHGPPGWLIGVLAAILVIVLGGAAAFAYFKFFKAPGTVAGANAMVTSASSAGAMPATAASTQGMTSMASAPSGSNAPASDEVAAAQEAAASAQTTAAVQEQTPPVAPAATEPVAAAPPVSAPAQPAAPVDHGLKIASDLVDKGERAYSRGDYDDAIRHARSALDVRPGYSRAQRLLSRARSAQQRAVAQEQSRQAEAVAAADAAARAKAAALAAATPTPDQIYGDRAHKECARGFFGKACRHKIRQQVCAGVSLTAPGTSVCKDLKD